MSKQSKQKRKGKRVSPKPRRTLPPPKPREIDLDTLTVEILLAATENWPDKILVDVGVDLHEGRKAQPLLDDEKLTYDERIGIHYAPLDVISCGFRIQAKPRRIGCREVAGCADPSCKKCHGVGWWRIKRDSMTGRDKIGQKVIQPLEYEQTCRCADRAYKRQNRQFLVDSQDGEWIALDDLTIEVEDGDVQPPKDNELRGDLGVPSVPEKG